MADSGARHRVVITGMGVVTPIGQTVADFWTALKQGRSGVGPVEGVQLDNLKIRIAAQIRDFDHARRLKHWQRDKSIMHSERYCWLAAAAADEAIIQSGLEVPFEDANRAACIIGSAAGGQISGEIACRDRFLYGKSAVHPMLLPRIVGSSAAAHVGIEYGVKGPTFATCSAGASAAHAIGIGRDYIRNGLVDVAIVGASDSMITYGVMLACQAMHLLSPQGCFPFSRKRNGTVLAEGAGVLVLESERHAAKRGAKMLAQLCGFGMSSSGNDMVTPDVEGTAEAMRRALDDARLRADCHRLSERARHGDDRERYQRNQRRQTGVWQACLQVRHLLDQVDAWSSDGPCRSHRSGGLPQGHGGRLAAADHWPRREGSPLRPRLCAERRTRKKSDLHHVEFVRLGRIECRARFWAAARVSPHRSAAARCREPTFQEI